MRAVSSAWVLLVSLAGSYPANASIAVDESKLKAVLQGGTTTILVPVVNAATMEIGAGVTVEWLDRFDAADGRNFQEVRIAPGSSEIAIPCPIKNSSIWTRLRYTLEPDVADARRFTRISATVSLARIAQHIFTLQASLIGEPQPGIPITVHARAVHPVTGRPVDGVKWEAVLNDEGAERKPIHQAHLEDGFEAFTFAPPATAGSIGLDITAKRGDFEQDVSLRVDTPTQSVARIQSDKPIYQPGQTLHLRAVILDRWGRAANGAKVTLTVDDPEGERELTKELTASAFGVVHGDYPISPAAALGEYRIVIREVDSAIGSHAVRVSRYDLPAFTVQAKPDSPVFLPGQKAQITVTGQYLFGKPVPRGHVKIVKTTEPAWSREKRRFVTNDIDVAEGDAGADGIFRATVDLSSEHKEIHGSPSRRFSDVHLAAYFTDPLSGRTEQRRFDVRVSPEPLHVYFFASAGSHGYVATCSADGRPIPATVEIFYSGGAVHVETNRYGVGRVPLTLTRHERMSVRATAADGRAGTAQDAFLHSRKPGVSIESARTMHSAGDAVTLRLAVPSGWPADQTLLVHAVAGRQLVASRAVQIRRHRGEVTFPYQKEFRRVVQFVVSSPEGSATRAVVFPDGSDLRLTVRAEKASYRPGETAGLGIGLQQADGTPLRAALGVAVVDPAVLERVRTDRESASRPWFGCAFCQDPGETEIGGLRLNDLYRLPPGGPDLDLVAEALVARETAPSSVQVSENWPAPPDFLHLREQVTRLRTRLNEHFAATLDFPRNEAELFRILRPSDDKLEDPWGLSFLTSFDADGSDYVITLRSAGPDKRRGTDDDFVAGTIRKSYFLATHQMVRAALARARDYPRTEKEFTALLQSNGLFFPALRDPWGTPFGADFSTWGRTRAIAIRSAGPDRTIATEDDVTLGSYTGNYFQRETEAIEAILRVAQQPPKTADGFIAILREGGIDIAAFRDDWGRPYNLESAVQSQYRDLTKTRTVQVFGQPARSVTDLVPATQKVLRIALRSLGPDGEPGTYDDFDIATFFFPLADDAAVITATAQAPASLRGGTGAIGGVVLDPAGATVPGAAIVLFDALERPSTTVSGPDGRFHFSSVPPGTYSLRIELAGFNPYSMLGIPVIAARATEVEAVLQVGSVSEAVTVEAESPMLQTSATSQMLAGPMATPRVREYFPETLLWIPELTTGADGHVRLDVPLAGNITNWKVAVTASTIDGKWTEAEGEIRTFQPLFVDFDPPKVLTQGDRIELPATIRNYEDRPQNVSVRYEAGEWAKLAGPASRETKVAPGESVNVTFPIETAQWTELAFQKLTATAGRNGDAMQKAILVNPDGRRTTQTRGDLLERETQIDFSIPVDAIRGATKGELRIYPNYAAILLESAAAILASPRGCAEQTISAGFANLIALRFLRASGSAVAELETRAIEHVTAAVRWVQSFGGERGGVPYWSGGTPDTAVTAHALQFLAEASAFHPVEGDRMERMAEWLTQAQGNDGRWAAPFDDAGRRSLLLTATVARALAAAKKAGIAIPDGALASAYHHLAGFTDRVDEPYMLAQFLLATHDSGDDALAGRAAIRLAALARNERGAVYWDLQTNTPFYGWGTAGRMETTGLAVSALAAWRSNYPEVNAAVRGGALFLLRNRDRLGAWYSTQATVRAMGAVADFAHSTGDMSAPGGAVAVHVNGRLVKTMTLPAGASDTNPIRVDVSPFLVTGGNQLTVTGGTGALVRLHIEHWSPWENAAKPEPAGLRLDVQFQNRNAGLGQPVRCSVKAERAGFRGYGMMLAEIGLPPGADVDRASLDALDPLLGVDHYEIQPDRIVFYLWPRAGGVSFDFYLRPRLRMTAKTGPSALFDYYNPDARTEVPPVVWTIQ